ncbi:hypothetical protein GQ457_02G026930 [Hibiscus cannabinus]
MSNKSMGKDMPKPPTNLPNVVNDLSKLVATVITRFEHNDVVLQTLTQTIAGMIAYREVPTNGNSSSESGDDGHQPRRAPRHPQNLPPRRLPIRDHRFDAARQVAREQPSLAKPKFSVPPFRGKHDPDAYCDWESKVELLFAYYKCPEEEKFPLVTLEFSDYALSWWTQLVRTR